MDIKSYLQAERALNIPMVETFLNQVEERYQALTPEFAQLFSFLKSYLIRGGKWHRPALAMLAYKIAGGAEEVSVRSSFSALELLHRYLLIHDDIIDQDYERHDGPTIERIYQEYFTSRYPKRNDEMYSKGTAIVAGDIVNSLAYELLTKADIEPNIVVAATQAFNQLMIETSAGWQLQTEQNFMSLSTVSKEAVINGMTLVSAQYSVVWPLRIGQIFAGRLKPESWDTQLETYGLNAGLAFQITDDVLGMFGDSSQTGKPVGHDYREGKKTILLLAAYDRASVEEKTFFESTLGTKVSESELSRVCQIMETTGALEGTRALARDYAQRAQESLIPLSTTHSEATTLLHELADLFANRAR